MYMYMQIIWNIFQVSEHVNSRLIVSNKETAGCSLEDNGTYNHLRENPHELHGQEDVADYDHCPLQATTDDMYSHMTAGNDELQDYDGDYGKINWQPCIHVCTRKTKCWRY